MLLCKVVILYFTNTTMYHTHTISYQYYHLSMIILIYYYILLNHSNAN